jgi:hypothetical protein
VLGFIILFAVMYWLADGVDKEEQQLKQYEDYLNNMRQLGYMV